MLASTSPSTTRDRSWLHHLAPSLDARTAAPPAPDTLIPIRLDVTVDNRRIQDTFSWNALETIVTPHAFAAMLIADLNLPSSAHAPIVEQINEQIAAHSVTPAHRESRHVVHLDVRIGRVVVRDQFEWDLADTSNAPDAFADCLCADLGLNTDHVPTVAHALREQLVELAHFQDKRQSCPVVTVSHAIRTNPTAWQPTVQCLTVDQQEKLERKEKREARLQRRNRGKADVFERPTPHIGRSRNSRSSRRQLLSR